MFSLTHTVERSDTLQDRGIVGSYQYRIVPS